MKCIILAAGYATRLYPLTENFPKPLLPVGDKAILDWLIDDLDATGLIDEYIVVSNHKFAGIFREWADGFGAEAGSLPCETSASLHPSYRQVGGPLPFTRPRAATVSQERLPASAPNPSASNTGAPLCHSERSEESIRRPIRVIDDGTSTNETRLGAVRDIQLAVKECGVDDDTFIMAGDNLLSFSLKEFLKYCVEKDASCIMRYAEENPARLHKSGIVEVDADDRVLSMEEKPAKPKSNWCCPPFYFYKREDIGKIDEAIADGCGVDAPGSLASWLSARTAVYAWRMPGPRFDIGSLDTYEEAKKMFRNGF